MYSETAAKPPMHPGTEPSSAATMTCPNLVLRSPLNKSPLDSIFKDSIIIIMITTKPVISTEFRNISISKCPINASVLFNPAGNKQVDNRAERGIGGESHNDQNLASRHFRSIQCYLECICLAWICVRYILE